MSSQGPRVENDVQHNGFVIGPSEGDPLRKPIYKFTDASVRDSSDWIARKKQRLILKENKAKLQSAHPELLHGNDYRIQYLLGRYKDSGDPCESCITNVLIEGRVPES